MKASTLFGVTVAILLGLGAMIGAKVLGVFKKEGPIINTPQELPKVLVAKQNLYENIAITPDQVVIRNLRPEELASYDKDKDKYLPPLTQAALLRIPLKNIEVDEPIRKDALQDLTIPDSTSLRLGKNMRAVNVALPKDRAAGGLIQIGERVDVLLTSNVTGGAINSKTTRSAFLARNLRVIVKRNNLWTVLAPIPEDQPIRYTLEANPYRAALIEFAHFKGTITLMPSPSSGTPTKPGVITASDEQPAPMVDSAEYREEERRVSALMKGELSVGEADLERIFNLPAIQPAPKPVIVTHMSGINVSGQSAFSPVDGSLVGRTEARDGANDRSLTSQLQREPIGYAFSIPEEAGPSIIGQANGYRGNGNGQR